jgi:hypothetical protein
MPTGLVLQSHTTPNPNSLKYTTDAGAFASDGLTVIRSEADADGHPLGRALFAIEGVIDVLITPDFVTVTKAEDVAWEAVTPQVEAVLEEAVEA